MVDCGWRGTWYYDDDDCEEGEAGLIRILTPIAIAASYLEASCPPWGDVGADRRYAAGPLSWPWSVPPSARPLACTRHSSGQFHFQERTAREDGFYFEPFAAHSASAPQCRSEVLPQPGNANVGLEMMVQCRYPGQTVPSRMSPCRRIRCVTGRRSAPLGQRSCTSCGHRPSLTPGQGLRLPPRRAARCGDSTGLGTGEKRSLKRHNLIFACFLNSNYLILCKGMLSHLHCMIGIIDDTNDTTCTRLHWSRCAWTDVRLDYWRLSAGSFAASAPATALIRRRVPHPVTVLLPVAGRLFQIHAQEDNTRDTRLNSN